MKSIKLFKEFLNESTKGSVDTKDSPANKALKTKSKESGISMSILKNVYKRGMSAWNSGHRPGVSQQQWALGRVNSFITGVGGARKSDSDLWKKVKKNESNNYEDGIDNYMFFYNLETMLKMVDKLLEYDEKQLDEILEDGHDWAEDHISAATELMEHVYNYLLNRVDESQIFNYMFFSNLKHLQRYITELLDLNTLEIDNILDEHDWASDHISKSKENLEQVYNFILSTKKST